MKSYVLLHFLLYVIPIFPKTFYTIMCFHAPQNHTQGITLNDKYIYNIIYLVEFFFIKYSHNSWLKWWWLFLDD
jgi:hypothetical protein